MNQIRKPLVAFVDDEEDLAEGLAVHYSRDYETRAFTSSEEALLNVDESFAAVVADHRMPKMTGVQLLTKLRDKSPDTVRILLTAVADLIPLLALINEAKVFHYIPKAPVFPDEHMRQVLADAVRIYGLRQERRRNLTRLTEQNASLKAQLRVRTGEERSFDDLLGADPRLQNAIKLGKWAATNELPVLITGESGTGKDELARAIHFESKRKQRPFKKVNCAYFRPELAQAALCGYVKGAFTTAAEANKGILRQVDGGTLFLDEIGELSPDVQAFFLTFLDDGDIEPVGYSSTESLKANVRIIAATNRDLFSEAHSGKFRLDLFNRINGRPIHLPALRDRLSDLPVLAARAVIVAAAKLDLDNVPLSAGAIDYLRSLTYPGNVRELFNVIEHAIAEMQISDATTIEWEHVSAATRSRPILDEGAATEPGTLDQAVDQFTKQYVEATLKRHNYKLEPSAAELGRSVKNLFDLRKKLGISMEK